MRNDLTNPLQALISGAARALPARTGATERFQARLDSAGSGVVLLCDCSGSMAESAGSRRKIDLLRDAVASILPDLPAGRLVAFAGSAREVASPDLLPAPCGGTALHLGLDAAAALGPGKTVVISDGRPDHEDLALDAVGRLPGVLDVIYCGPDSDAHAVAFMRRLAAAGCGRVVVRDVVRDSRLQLAPALRETLGLPAPTPKTPKGA